MKNMKHCFIALISIGIGISITGCTNNDPVSVNGTSQNTPLNVAGVNDPCYPFVYNANQRWYPSLGYAAIPGQQTIKTPAIAMLNGKLYVFHRGQSSSSIFYTSSTDKGRTWSVQRTVPGCATSGEVSAINYKGRIYIFYRGNSTTGLFYMGIDGNGNWTAQNSIPNTRSKFGPYAVNAGGFVIVAHKGETNNNIYLAGGYPDLNTWRTTYNAISSATDVRPAVAATNGSVFVVYKNNNQVAVKEIPYWVDYYGWNINTSAYPGWCIPGANTLTGPSAHTSPKTGEIVAVYKGEYTNYIFYTAYKGNASGPWFSCQNKLLAAAETSIGPGSCTDDFGRPWFIFKGKVSYSVNISTLEW